MKTLQLCAVSLLMSSVLLLSGCGGGSSQKEEAPAAEPAAAPAAEAAPVATPAPTSSATAGQRLIDLNKAREAGAITDEEYEATKKKLLDAQ